MGYPRRMVNRHNIAPLCSALVIYVFGDEHIVGVSVLKPHIKVFSSPDHDMLKVRYCDRSVSIVHYPSCSDNKVL